MLLPPGHGWLFPSSVINQKVLKSSTFHLETIFVLVTPGGFDLFLCFVLGFLCFVGTFFKHSNYLQRQSLSNPIPDRERCFGELCQVTYFSWSAHTL